MTRRRLSAEETRLWALVAATARPLPGKRVAPAAFEPARNDLKAGAAAPKRSAGGRPPQLLEPPIRAPLGPAERSGEKRVRRGRVDLDGRLDLHGMTQMQARAALRGFLFGARERGGRCVLVVTGKGEASLRPYGHDSPGVLRRMLPEWLADADLRGVVAGYAPAHARHGGAGAWYVFVKRRT